MNRPARIQYKGSVFQSSLQEIASRILQVTDLRYQHKHKSKAVTDEASALKLFGANDKSRMRLNMDSEQAICCWCSDRNLGPARVCDELLGLLCPIGPRRTTHRNDIRRTKAYAYAREGVHII